jgi:hypothetical protein
MHPSILPASGRSSGEAGPEDAALDVGMLEHISPIEWDNVILYGQYILDRSLIR